MSGASLCGLPSRCCKLAALALASAGQHLDLQRVLSKPRRGPIGALLYARDTCHARANRRQHPCGNRGQCAGARRPKLSRPSVLLSLPLPAQCKFAVLQGSLQHRVAHLPVARWSVVEGAMSAAADAIADTALQIGNCQVSPGSEDDMYARAQLQLPMRHGGMGLHRLSPAEGSAASSHQRRSPMLPWRALRHNFAPSTAPSGRASATSGKHCATMYVSRIPMGGR